MFACAAVYVTISLVQNKTFDLDRMLHRGSYAPEADNASQKQEETCNATPESTFRSCLRKLGLSDEFSVTDKVLFGGCIFKYMTMWLVFLAFTLCNIFMDVPLKAWFTYWKTYVWLFLAVSVFVTIWFSIGGLMDLKDMFRRLKTIVRNDSDDGMVVDHHNRDEEEV